MIFLNLFITNFFAPPILAFILGILASITKFNIPLKHKIMSFFTYFLLFSIGLKGGYSFIEHSRDAVFSMLVVLIIWGLTQPFFSYAVLKKFAKIDSATAAAVAACFSSVSVMTYVAGTTFLQKLGVEYDGIVVLALAIMEVPAIISGLIVYKLFNDFAEKSKKQNLLKEAIFNKTILMIFTGMVVGAVSTLFKWNIITFKILILFLPILCLFLFNMGFIVGKHREHLKQFSWALVLFGLYMPLIGGAFGICLSYFFDLGVGTGTLIAVLTASASYIAVPAVMRLMLPEAQEAIYLPLSLGITFPFNVMIGIPIYYHISTKFLS